MTYFTFSFQLILFFFILLGGERLYFFTMEVSSLGLVTLNSFPPQTRHLLDQINQTLSEFKTEGRKLSDTGEKISSKNGSKAESEGLAGL